MPYLLCTVSGQIVVELSRHEDFHTVCRQNVMKVDQGTECAGSVGFEDLEPNTTWYQRAYLHYPRKGFDGASAGFYVTGNFILRRRCCFDGCFVCIKGLAAEHTDQ